MAKQLDRIQSVKAMLSEVKPELYKLIQDESKNLNEKFEKIEKHKCENGQSWKNLPQKLEWDVETIFSLKVWK